MKKLINLLFFCVLIVQLLQAQKYDNVWMLGYGPTFDTLGLSFGVTKIDFSNVNTPSMERISETDIELQETNIGMSDFYGQLQFYSNGNLIENALYQILENGDSIGNHPNEYSLPYQVKQGMIALPKPEKINVYGIFQMTWEHLLPELWLGTNLYYNEIDMAGNMGTGNVTIRKNNLLQDTFSFGQLTATKHANGRDWWVIFWENKSNVAYHLLFGTEGIIGIDTQHVSSSLNSRWGQAVFSPDGSKYAIMTYNENGEDDVWIDFFNFDRCTGLLSHMHQTYLPDYSWTGGAAFSLNSRFLYINSSNKIYQFDLWENDSNYILLDEYDGYANPIACDFYLLQLAPDGKIYGACGGASSNLHVIDYPNKKGLLCSFRQHGINLPTLSLQTVPNHPNYRLGPIDGSPCDTLGLDNVPVALFRYAPDTLNGLQVEFTDLSYYEPATWHWDFGDNLTSQDTSPVHIYPQAGEYETCLTVSNQYGEHTYCDSVYLDANVSTTEERGRQLIEVFPNPSGDFIKVKLPSNINAGVETIIQDLNGRTIWSGTISDNAQIDVALLPSGMYFITVSHPRGNIQTVKFIKR